MFGIFSFAVDINSKREYGNFSQPYFEAKMKVMEPVTIGDSIRFTLLTLTKMGVKEGKNFETRLLMYMTVVARMDNVVQFL